MIVRVKSGSGGTRADQGVCPTSASLEKVPHYCRPHHHHLTVMTTDWLCWPVASERTCAVYIPGRRSSGNCAVIWPDEVCSSGMAKSLKVTQEPPSSVGAGI